MSASSPKRKETTKRCINQSNDASCHNTKDGDAKRLKRQSSKRLRQMLKKQDKTINEERSDE